ncbi:hypothetical protein GWO43_28385 [candidate division KSB1 bacterium]|nr:hypothetical protein [candidate division KSB1 bacterium]NIR70814.1 hypothetical protein [candidate division KSB1 bacterium]NIS27826.1 hypothetical protein [candidate division KSB1 bacterium]NIT74708.1 hypothetical protein [candidate division KSB1 bacterium]NIU28491.1 hypothetical protein [candidate division KSB1 bacterium]
MNLFFPKFGYVGFQILVVTFCLFMIKPVRLSADDKEKKPFLGPLSLNFEPTLTVSPLGTPALVTDIASDAPGDTSRLERAVEFELIFALEIPTGLPRISLTGEVIWTPFATTDRNPFTGSTSAELGQSIRENPVELEAELNFALFTSEQTGGWLDMHFDVVDQFSPAEQPDDRAWYTHKLNFELDTAFMVFNWLPESNWLHSLELEVSLDYLATGLPGKGDVVSAENIRYLNDANRWSLSFLFVLPLAPAH